MAGWADKFNKVTQSAISKSKEMAEITRLNMEISNFTQSRKEICTQIGEYIVENDLMSDDEKILELKNKVIEITTGIQNNEERIKEIRNINICPNCGAEVSRSSKFCDKCGAEIIRAALENMADNETKCKNCGAVLEEGAIFCGACGSKQE